MAFRIKSKMVQSIKMNFKGSHKENFSFDECESGSDDTQCYAMICNGWKEQREGLDLTVMSDMVIFFTRILEKKGVKRDYRVCPEDRLCRRLPAAVRKLLVETSPKNVFCTVSG